MIYFYKIYCHIFRKEEDFGLIRRIKNLDLQIIQRDLLMRKNTRSRKFLRNERRQKRYFSVEINVTNSSRKQSDFVSFLLQK